MQFTRRHTILLGSVALAGGTLAAATLWRKPEPRIFTTADASQPKTPLAGLVENPSPAPPPEAHFVDNAGKSHTIADFAGQGLILNLWATWCIPCVAEMPQLEAAAAALAGDRIAVLPLSSDRGGAEIVRKFYTDHAIKGLDIWLDPKSEATRAWHARGLPTTLIIDRRGREVARLEGAAEWAHPEALTHLRRLVG